MTNREYINQMDNAELFELFFCYGLCCENCPAKNKNKCGQTGCFNWLNDEVEM